MYRPCRTVRCNDLMGSVLAAMARQGPRRRRRSQEEHEDGRGEGDADSAEEEEESEGYDDSSLSSAEVDVLYLALCKQFDGRDERLRGCLSRVLAPAGV